MNSHTLSTWLLAIVLLAAVVAGCGRGDDGEIGENKPDSAAVSDTTSQGDEDRVTEDGDDPVPVDVAVLGRGPIETVIRASATLEAESEVDVVAEAARRVQRIRVEEGDRVKVGQILLDLQDEEQRSIVAKTESRLAQAERELVRQKSLRQRDLTSDQTLNDAQYEYDQQKIALEDAKRELSYTKVRASIPGIVTARMVNVGDQVQIGQELFHIIDFESLVARIYVPEKYLKQLHEQQRARVTARAVSDEPYEASVLRVSPVVDPRTGTVKVTLAVGGQPGLRPGLFADVELVTAVNEDALLVPKRALIYDNDQVFVYRLGDGRRVNRLLITPALADKDFIEPAAGLSEGDTIVIAGQTGLRNGVRVSLVGESEAPEENGESEAPGDRAEAASP